MHLFKVLFLPSWLDERRCKGRWSGSPKRPVVWIAQGLGDSTSPCGSCTPWALAQVKCAENQTACVSHAPLPLAPSCRAALLGRAMLEAQPQTSPFVNVQITPKASPTEARSTCLVETAGQPQAKGFTFLRSIWVFKNLL